LMISIHKVACRKWILNKEGTNLNMSVPSSTLLFTYVTRKPT
jgi:hypothetical protein